MALVAGWLRTTILLAYGSVISASSSAVTPASTMLPRPPEHSNSDSPGPPGLSLWLCLSLCECELEEPFCRRFCAIWSRALRPGYVIASAASSLPAERSDGSILPTLFVAPITKTPRKPSCCCCCCCCCCPGGTVGTVSCDARSSALRSSSVASVVVSLSVLPPPPPRPTNKASSSSRKSIAGAARLADANSEASVRSLSPT